MDGARILLTGASGFLGRHLVEALGPRYEILAISRASPSSRGAALAARCEWFYVDIGDSAAVAAACERIRHRGPVEAVLHLAAHYDFTGERHPEYQRTNVEGTRNVLAAAHELDAKDFVFASSVAACRFPPPGQTLDESSTPDGDSPYSESKRAGEAIVAADRDGPRCWIVRFGALFSDWCEYEPLYRLLETWLSRHPRRRALAGRGESGLPYLHVRDAVQFVETVLERRDELDPRQTLIACPDGAITHRELFSAATAAHFGERARPLFVPRGLCRAGLELRALAERAGVAPAFERPWMSRYIDLQLRVDASRTRERLGWEPRPRLDLRRRMPFLIENRKSMPLEWHKRNHAALRLTRLHENLRIHELLENRAHPLATALVDYLLDPERRDRFVRLREQSPERTAAESALLVQALLAAILTGEKARFREACHDLASRRRREGFPLAEVVAWLNALNDLTVLELSTDAASADWFLALYDHVTMTVQFGIDEAYDDYDAET